MSALAAQHERWSAARARLWPARRVEAAPQPEAPQPPPKPPKPPETLAMRMERQRNIDIVAKAVSNKPDLAVIFPDIWTHVDAGYLPSAFIYMAAAIPPANMPRWKAIGLEVAAKHKVRFSDLQSVRRDHASVVARQEAFWRCREETNLSLPQIGRFFGGRDHTTVLYGIRKHEMRLKEAENG